MVDAPQRQLAVLRRAAQDPVGAALLGPLVVGVADEHPGALADVLIHLAGKVPERVVGEVGREHVVVAPRIAARRRRRVRLQEVLPEARRSRIDPVGRNLVVGKRVAHPLPVLEAAGGRIVDRNQPALRVAQVAEVAAELGGVRHGVGGGGRRRLLVALVVEHEKRLVAAVVQAREGDGSVKQEAVLIQLVIRLLDVVHLEEILVRVERLAPRELVDRSVQRVGARLEGDVHHAVGGAAVLRVVAVGDDFELLDRIHRRHIRDVVAPLNGVVRGAVEQELVVAVLAAVDGPVRDGPVVEGPVVDGGAVVVHPRHQHGEHERVARVERQLVHAIVVDHQAAVRLGRLEDGRFGHDAHLLAQLTELELEVHRRGLADFEPDVGLTHFPEAGELRGDGVEAGAEKRNRVHALGRRRRGGELAGVVVGRGDGGARNDQAVRVADAAGHGGAELLGDNSSRCQRDEEKDDGWRGRDSHGPPPPQCNRLQPFTNRAL